MVIAKVIGVTRINYIIKIQIGSVSNKQFLYNVNH